MVMSKNRHISERFWEKVATGDGCWLWLASIYKNGYGRFGVAPGELGNVSVMTSYAHRVAYALHNGLGSLPGSFVCHRCDVPSCVRPSHLWLGTSADNTRDMLNKGRGRWRGLCKLGHDLSIPGSRTANGKKCAICQRAYIMKWKSSHKAVSQ